MLLESGANVNDYGGEYCDKSNKTTPLMDASTNGHVDVVRLLHQYGADLTQTNIEVQCVVVCPSDPHGDG